MSSTYPPQRCKIYSWPSPIIDFFRSVHSALPPQLVSMFPNPVNDDCRQTLKSFTLWLVAPPNILRLSSYLTSCTASSISIRQNSVHQNFDLPSLTLQHSVNAKTPSFPSPIFCGPCSPCSIGECHWLLVWYVTLSLMSISLLP